MIIVVSMLFLFMLQLIIWKINCLHIQILSLCQNLLLGLFLLFPCFFLIKTMCCAILPLTLLVSVVMQVSFRDYFNFCQGKNNWCGYYYSFACWCHRRSLTWLLCTFLCTVGIIKMHDHFHKWTFVFSGMDDLRDWTNNVQPSIPIYTAARDFEVITLCQMCTVY